MTQKRRSNIYKGAMTSTETDEKLARLQTRLALTELVMERGRGLDTGSVTLSFGYHGARVLRTCGTQPTSAANAACLALWLEDRARNLERGIETFSEAFADSLEGVKNDNGAEEVRSKRKAAYEGTRSVEDSIEVFRSSFERLGIAERDVKVTWDTEVAWARVRMRLPSGAIVEKVSRGQKNSEANLAVLALWIQSRARNWERGIESLDLDLVFAGNLLPARVA